MLACEALLRKVQLALGTIESDAPTAEAALMDRIEYFKAFRRESSKQAAFLERQGYRRCDIPACNCGSWHKWEAQ